MSLQRWIVVVAILLLGLLSRGLRITSHSFWIDEGFSFFYAYSPDLIQALASDIHPPLYYAVLRLRSELTGHSELALRWFSLAPSVGSLACVFQLAKEVIRARSPLWAGEALPFLAMLMLALGGVALVYRRDLILAYVAAGGFPLRYYLVRDEAGVPALEAGNRYEALHHQRLFATETYEAWLTSLLDGQQTVWLMYWSGDNSVFNWLEQLDFKRSARYAHRHDGGARHRPG